MLKTLPLGNKEKCIITIIMIIPDLQYIPNLTSPHLCCSILKQASIIFTWSMAKISSELPIFPQYEFGFYKEWSQN
jgi:hypothetical protein